MKIKKNDEVVAISGGDKGKKGKVTRAFPSIGKVIVEGLNLKKRHIKSKKSGKKGQILAVPSPIHVSNLKLAKGRGESENKAVKK